MLNRIVSCTFANLYLEFCIYLFFFNCCIQVLSGTWTFAAFTSACEL